MFMKRSMPALIFVFHMIKNKPKTTGGAQPLRQPNIAF